MTLLTPFLVLLFTLINSLLTKALTNGAKGLSTSLNNGPALLKQVVAAVLSLILPLLTIIGIHVSGTSLDTLTAGDFGSIIMAVGGWLGAMLLHNSSKLSQVIGAALTSASSTAPAPSASRAVPPSVQ